MFNASLTVGNEVLDEARESKSIIHELGALIQIAYANMMIHNIDQSNAHIADYDLLWEGLSDEKKENFRELEGYIYHLKGTLFLLHHDTDRCLAILEKSLEIQKSVDNSLEINASLNNLSWINIWIGEYDKGLDYANQQLALGNDLGNQYVLIGAYENLGMLEELKGKFDSALDYFTKGFDIADKLNLRFSSSNLRGHIAGIYYLMGDYELAFKNLTKELLVLEDLNMNIFAADVISDLIRISIKLGLTKQTENYMKKLNKLYESHQIKGIELSKKISQALILKNNPRSKDKITAQNLFEEVINESQAVGMSSIAILHLTELLLDELKTYGSEEVLEEIEDKTRQLYELAQEHKLYPLIIEVLILRAKLAFLKLELDEATKILNQANLIAEERGLANLISLVEEENRKLENEISLAAEITRKASSIQSRMDKAEIIAYIEKMQKLIKVSQ